MQPHLRSTAPLWLAFCLLAQDGAKGKARSPAQADYDTIVAELEAAQAAYSKAIKEAQATDEYKAAAEEAKKLAATVAALRKQKLVDTDEYKAAAAALSKHRAAMSEVMKKVPRIDTAPITKKALDAAEKYAGQDDAIQFLVFALNSGGDKELAKKTAEQLLEKHGKSPKLLELVENPPRGAMVLGKEGAIGFLDKIATVNESDLVKAYALYWKATFFLSRSENADDKAEASKVLAQAEKLASAHPELLDRIRAPRFEKENLQEGMVAPDIEGVDLDGKTFKLSDYRGKVVLLDFWGDW